MLNDREKTTLELLEAAKDAVTKLFDHDNESVFGERGNLDTGTRTLLRCTQEELRRTLRDFE